MAYVDFSGDPVLAAYCGAGGPDAAAAEPAALSALEWSVVALAQRDRLSSLDQPGRLALALGKVFGTPRRSPHLADPRLEALRRMAVLSWHRGFAVPAHEVKAFFRAGFSGDQYELMLASIGAARSRMGASRLHKSPN
ncbi:hypothetical protein ACFSC3_09995 [Sphingomonas floccifaciens]|uniref:Uncharacterized protein n=1 Tax=Sphingomonas floccifaciens TaxID=1844115 RepID=A0ABW4NCS7_9SPHN